MDDNSRDLAFWLQDKIYREGLEPIWFMRRAERWAKSEASDVVADAISRRLK
ncbi:hypothetical protein SAMN04488133_2008 [Halobellus limi]|uniref:Uncharacterized protein n=1 Tax=Halobellus limi TaxID=699433 RepID=A0A1H5ZK04_9EURY|nr:hypothetical protein SAMN04488133_2008 [Halobellus limi]